VVPFIFSLLGRNILIASASAETGRSLGRFYRREAIRTQLILDGLRIMSRHLQIDGPIDGNRLILHHFPLKRTVARSPWPTAAFNLARRHRHFRPFR